MIKYKAMRRQWASEYAETFLGRYLLIAMIVDYLQPGFQVGLEFQQSFLLD